MKPHKHSALIKQWADGHKVEILGRVDGGWHEAEYPDWDEDYTYRIKDLDAKHKWVELTDAEIAEAVGCPLDEVYLADFRKVIAKLKELNND